MKIIQLIKKMLNGKKRIAGICLAGLICLAFSAQLQPAAAMEALNRPMVSEFAADTETVYSAPRAKAVASSAFSWKLTDSGQSIQNQYGLTVSKGFISLAKDNPVNASKGFVIETVYASAYEDADADPASAFLYTSDSAYNTQMAFNDPKSLLGIAENGDVYYKGEKINKPEAADVLNSKNSAIAPGDECALTVTYLNGKLSVSLTYGKTTRKLVSGYACELSGLRQLQIGADRTADKRQENITYNKVTFAVYGEYVPENIENIKAALSINGIATEYTSADKALNDALRSAKEGKNVYLELYSDLKLSGSVTIEPGMDLTIDLNGFTIDRGRAGYMSSNGYVFLLENGAALTVTDSSPDKAHEHTSIKGGIITGGAGDDAGGAFQLRKNSTLTMTGGSVAGCVSNDHGAAVRVAGSGVTANFCNVGFYANFTCDSSDNCHGGAIYGDDDCRIILTNCTFDGNYSEDNGGAIYMNEGTVNAFNCIFTGNKALDDGGAVYLESGTDSHFDGCRFYDSRADGHGGAVYCNSSKGTRISGIIRNNSCGGSGGGVYVNNDGFCIMDAEVIENKAGKHGGGIYVDEMYDLNVQGLMNIRNNFNSAGERDNVFLDSALFTEAYIYDGGLYENSLIYVGTGNSDHTVIKNVSTFQSRYFISDSDSKTFKFTEDSGKTEQQMLTTSAISSGNLIFIAVSAVLCIAAVILVIIINRKRKKEGGENR